MFLLSIDGVIIMGKRKNKNKKDLSFPVSIFSYGFS
uniref:Uncharacterized protein n=1 Tax=Rhizophora mucronata TaxID=61149 RepID=A0A2P2R536_RHIMU